MAVHQCAGRLLVGRNSLSKQSCSATISASSLSCLGYIPSGPLALLGSGLISLFLILSIVM